MYSKIGVENINLCVCVNIYIQQMIKPKKTKWYKYVNLSTGVFCAVFILAASKFEIRSK